MRRALNCARQVRQFMGVSLRGSYAAALIAINEFDAEIAGLDTMETEVAWMFFAIGEKF